jgi:hypothetical protein
MNIIIINPRIGPDACLPVPNIPRVGQPACTILPNHKIPLQYFEWRGNKGQRAFNAPFSIIFQGFHQLNDHQQSPDRMSLGRSSKY